MKRRYKLLYQFLHEYIRKSWTHRFDLPHWEIFKIRNTSLKFRSPGHGWERKNKKKHTENCKARWVSCKRSKSAIEILINYILSMISHETTTSICKNNNNKKKIMQGKHMTTWFDVQSSSKYTLKVIVNSMQKLRFFLTIRL